MDQSKRNEISTLIGLILLGLVPVVFGVFRLKQIVQGEITSDNARFLAHPFLSALHIGSAVFYSLLAPLQFSAKLRTNFLNAHRIIGSSTIAIGFVASLTGLWMTQTFPAANDDNFAVYLMRLSVGIMMSVSLTLGVHSLFIRDFSSHGKWMIRAYALGMGAGTQVLTHIPVFFFPMIRGEIARAIMMGWGWLINILIAEYIIRKSTSFNEEAYIKTEQRNRMGDKK